MQLKRRQIVVEIEIPGGDPDYTHFLESGNPWDVLPHGNVVFDDVLSEVPFDGAKTEDSNG